MVSDFEDQGDSVVVTTVEGQTFSGAALVAAGGVRSRQKLIGDDEPRSSGYVALRTIIPIAEPAYVDDFRF
jgi:3-hydroxybenzoate 6-monooxygenase